MSSLGKGVSVYCILEYTLWLPVIYTAAQIPSLVTPPGPTGPQIFCIMNYIKCIYNILHNVSKMYDMFMHYILCQRQTDQSRKLTFSTSCDSPVLFDSPKYRIPKTCTSFASLPQSCTPTQKITHLSLLIISHPTARQLRVRLERGPTGVSFAIAEHAGLLLTHLV